MAKTVKVYTTSTCPYCTMLNWVVTGLTPTDGGTGNLD